MKKNIFSKKNVIISSDVLWMYIVNSAMVFRSSISGSIRNYFFENNIPYEREKELNIYFKEDY